MLRCTPFKTVVLSFLVLFNLNLLGYSKGQGQLYVNKNGHISNKFVLMGYPVTGNLQIAMQGTLYTVKVEDGYVLNKFVVSNEDVPYTGTFSVQGTLFKYYDPEHHHTTWAIEVYAKSAQNQVLPRLPQGQLYVDVKNGDASNRFVSNGVPYTGNLQITTVQGAPLTIKVKVQDGYISRLVSNGVPYTGTFSVKGAPLGGIFSAEFNPLFSRTTGDIEVYTESGDHKDEWPREVYHEGERGLLYQGQFASWSDIFSGIPDEEHPYYHGHTHRANFIFQQYSRFKPPDSQKLSKFKTHPQAMTMGQFVVAVTSAITLGRFVKDVVEWREEQGKLKELNEKLSLIMFLPSPLKTYDKLGNPVYKTSEAYLREKEKRRVDRKKALKWLKENYPDKYKKLLPIHTMSGDGESSSEVERIIRDIQRTDKETGAAGGGGLPGDKKAPDLH